MFRSTARGLLLTDTAFAATSSPRKKRRFVDIVAELLLWVLAVPIVSVLWVTLATPAQTTLMVVIGVLVLAGGFFLVKPWRRLGRGRAVGLLYFALLLGVSTNAKQELKSYEQIDARRAARLAASLPPAAAATEAVNQVPVGKPSSPPPTAASPKPSATAETQAPPVRQAEPKSRWRYSTSKDEMRGTTARFAHLASDTVLNLGFPYDAGPVTLTLRERSQDGLNIYLQVDGQFMCNSFSEETVAVKFDDGEVENIECDSPSDGSSKTLFVQGGSAFVDKLREAKKLIIEAQFFQNGRKQVRFSPAGLKWE